MLHQSRWPNMQLNSADTSIRKPGLGRVCVCVCVRERERERERAQEP
ncbi:hypothetical protein LEMLEM_LOCUS27508 [Lemmus lemmus]